MGRHEKRDHELEELDAESVDGGAAEKAGQTPGDQDIDAQGDHDRVKGRLEQAGEKVWNAFRR